MRTKSIEFESAGVDLAGTYRSPDSGRCPAALILGGSWPLDRDGNVKRMRVGVSRYLADVFGDLGWASLRYDKRGVGESSGDYLSTGLFEELDDARAAHRWLVSQPNVEKTIVVGHSMGASLAVELAVDEPEISGVVMLAGRARLGEEVLSWQTNKIKDDVVPKPIAAVMRLFGTDVVKQQAKAVKKLKASTTDVARVNLAKTNAKWMREMIAYDPPPSLRKARQQIRRVESKRGQKDPV